MRPPFIGLSRGERADASELRMVSEGRELAALPVAPDGRRLRLGGPAGQTFTQGAFSPCMQGRGR